MKEKLNDEDGQAGTLHNLGVIVQERGQFDEAEAWYRKSLKIKEKLKDEYGQASTLHQLGTIAQERRQFDKARNLYLQAEAIFKKHDDKHLLSVVRASLERLQDRT